MSITLWNKWNPINRYMNLWKYENNALCWRVSRRTAFLEIEWRHARYRGEAHGTVTTKRVFGGKGCFATVLTSVVNYHFNDAKFLWLSTTRLQVVLTKSMKFCKQMGGVQWKWQWKFPKKCYKILLNLASTLTIDDHFLLDSAVFFFLLPRSCRHLGTVATACARFARSHMVGISRWSK